MTIQGNLRAVAALAAGSLLFMAVLIGRSLNSLSELEGGRVLIQRIETGVLTLRREEKDFLARLDRKYVNAFEKQITDLKARTGELIGVLETNAIGTGDVRRLDAVLERYHAAFKDVVAHNEKMGLTPDTGFQGDLRTAIHEVENAIGQLGDDGLMAGMLMLRRNEKDFMLRHDMKYRDTFDKTLAETESTLSARPYPEATKKAIGDLLARYHERFVAYVEQSKALGLKPDQGVLGAMRETVHETETLIAGVVGMTDKAVDARAAEIKRNATLLAVVLGAVVVAIILFIGRGIARRLKLAAGAMEQIRDRNDLTLRLDTDGGDELAALGSDFNSMMTSFATLVREVGASVSRLSAAAEELSAVTEQTSEGMRRQQGETEGVAAAMHEMSATVDEIARTTEQAAESARQADSEARQGQLVVAGAVAAIERLADDVKRAGEAMGKLEDETKGIGAILDVIRSVAEQTNLLALNAAIEAARAGEQGRGFAVVADEVRNLAQRTQQSVGEIEIMIRRLQVEAGEAMQVMVEGGRKSEASVREANAVSSSLDVLVQGVAAISDLNIHIASASSQQRSVTEDVSRNVVAIKHVTDETAGSVAHVAASSHELADVAHRLDNVVRRFTV